MNKIIRSNIEGVSPSPSEIGYGDIAVNFNANSPFLSIKTDGNKIVKIPTEESIDSIAGEKVGSAVTASMGNYYTKDEEDGKLAEKADTATTYTKEEVNSLIDGVSSLKKAIVDSLPTTDIDEATIYLVKTSRSDENDIYDEYLYINSKWERIGSTQMSLDGYATESWVEGKGYLTTESEPAFTSSPASGITEDDIANWNNKSEFDGDYESLTNKPTIPSIEGLESSEHAEETYQPKGDYVTADKTLTMVATLEDGSTKTYTLFGVEV